MSICSRTCKTKSPNPGDICAWCFCPRNFSRKNNINTETFFLKRRRWSRVRCQTPERASEARPHAMSLPGKRDCSVGLAGPNQERKPASDARNGDNTPDVLERAGNTFSCTHARTHAHEYMTNSQTTCSLSSGKRRLPFAISPNKKKYGPCYHDCICIALHTYTSTKPFSTSRVVGIPILQTR